MTSPAVPRRPPGGHAALRWGGLPVLLRWAQWPLWLVAGLGAESILWRHGTGPQYVVYDLGVCFGALAVGLAVWETEPRSRLGPLLAAYFGWALVAPVRYFPHPVTLSLSVLADSLVDAVFIHVVLAFPQGRVTGRINCLFVVVAYCWTAFLACAQLLVAPSEELFGGCLGAPCPAHPPWLAPAPVAWDVVQSASTVGDAVVATAFLGLVVRRLVRAPRPARSRMLALTAVAFLVVAKFVITSFLPAPTGAGWTADDLADHVLLVLLALVFVGHLYAGRTRRSRIADALAELAGARPDAVQPVLARILRDPSVRIGIWDDAGRTYVDPAGEAVDEQDPSWTISRIDGPSGRLGVLARGPGADPGPRELAAVLGAVRLALENWQLQAQLRTQLEEVRRSRLRLVDAEDDARRRLERDLHDGAQQRLLTVGLALQLASADALAAPGLLKTAQDEVRLAIEDLRDLARGIHPAVLTDQGFATAVRALAAYIDIPVLVEDRSPARPPPPIEAAMYFLTCEAVQNSVKHAAARHVWVCVGLTALGLRLEIRDDGVGGAQPSAGGGLAGMADRVDAVGGSLTVDSPPGAGTRIVAELPCEW